MFWDLYKHLRLLGRSPGFGLSLVAETTEGALLSIETVAEGGMLPEVSCIPKLVVYTKTSISAMIGYTTRFFSFGRTWERKVPRCCVKRSQR